MGLLDFLKKYLIGDVPEQSKDYLLAKPFFVSASKLRKTDGHIKRGNCEIEFKKDIFCIKQNDQTIENSVESIYYFDIWDYKDDTYFKIRMRSMTEYIFKSVYFDADKISDYLKPYEIKIEDNRDE